jgi:hypothetical protein
MYFMLEMLNYVYACINTVSISKFSLKVVLSDADYTACQQQQLVT